LKQIYFEFLLQKFRNFHANFMPLPRQEVLFWAICTTMSTVFDWKPTLSG